MYLLGDGRLGIMYANEKHVVETPSLDQVISERTSGDDGATWSDEIIVASQPTDNSGTHRPGMPVWTKMTNGNYIVVFEVCGAENCAIQSKISSDGVSWDQGLGASIPGLSNALYILSFNDGTLFATAGCCGSGNGQVSYSIDFGQSWPVTNSAFQVPRFFQPLPIR